MTMEAAKDIAADGPRQGVSLWRQKLRLALLDRDVQRLMVNIALILLIGAVTHAAGGGKFFTFRNIDALVVQISVMTIIACAMTLVMVAGAIDISAPGTVALTGVIAGLLIVRGVPMWPAFLLATLTGVVVGARQQLSRRHRRNHQPHRHDRLALRDPGCRQPAHQRSAHHRASAQLLRGRRRLCGRHADPAADHAWRRHPVRRHSEIHTFRPLYGGDGQQSPGGVLERGQRAPHADALLHAERRRRRMGRRHVCLAHRQSRAGRR